MAQTEDTELRDLVIEALERNGSLAKIRALLRANVFLAFEDERENMKQNVSLDNVLKQPEGIISLSIVHEFLEFCNLKNTLFVYMSESRQRKEYNYEGSKVLADKLNILKRDNSNEPLLVTLVKNSMKPCQRKYYDQGDCNNLKANEKCNDINYKDEQNCTYIVHEDSGSATSNSNSDNSSDEKNKLHLRLQLDNSDTDTSSDSTRDKSSSEYIPSEHVVMKNMEIESKKVDNSKIVSPHHTCSSDARNPITSDVKNMNYLQNLKLFNNSSSDSTSYIDLKPFNPIEKKLLNTTGVPLIEADEQQLLNSMVPQAVSNVQGNSKTDPISSASLSNSSLSKTEDKSSKTGIEESGKTDVETAEYSYDFSTSPVTKNITGANVKLPDSVQEEFALKSPNNNSTLDSPHQNSQSSQSSVSISDVADLISEKSLSFSQQLHKEQTFSDKSKVYDISDNSKKISTDRNKNDDSMDLSESPVPSLSNLSLDVHSD